MVTVEIISWVTLAGQLRNNLESVTLLVSSLHLCHALPLALTGSCGDTGQTGSLS